MGLTHQMICSFSLPLLCHWVNQNKLTRYSFYILTYYEMQRLALSHNTILSKPLSFLVLLFHLEDSHYTISNSTEGTFKNFQKSKCIYYTNRKMIIFFSYGQTLVKAAYNKIPSYISFLIFKVLHYQLM